MAGKSSTFVAAAAIPYLVQRTALEATYELSFRRYTHSLTRSLRLDSVLGGDARALTAVAASDLTLEAHASTLETSARRCYELASRKVFSVPKLLLFPTMISRGTRRRFSRLCPSSWRWTGPKREVLRLSRKRWNGDGRRPRL